MAVYESMGGETTLLGFSWVLSGSVVSSQFLNISLSLSLSEQLNHFPSSHLDLRICPKGNHNSMLVNIPPFLHVVWPHIVFLTAVILSG